MKITRSKQIGWTDFLKDTDETVLIFYSYNVELDTLKKVCKKLDKKYIVINGANTNKYATIMNEEYDVILGQFEACGESIDNLQYKCHICVYYAMPESSRVHRQALGRIDRDGQVDVPIYYYLIAEGTLEEKIYELTKTKTEYSK